MSSVHPQMIPVCIVPMTFLFVLLVVLVTKSPRAGAWLVGTLAFLFPMLVFRAAKAGVFATPVALPLFIVPMTFLFILLMVLISKSPKAGAWIVGGLTLLFPMLAYWAAMVHAFAMPVALPLLIVPATFLFILVVVVLSKTPKAGTALVVGLVVMGLSVLVLVPLMSHGRVVRPRTQATLSYGAGDLTTRAAQQQTDSGAGSAVAHQEFERVFQDFVSLPSGVTQPPVPPTPPWAPAPIWSEAVETQFDADVYPSQLAAVRAMGLRLDRTIRELVKDVNSPRIVLFQESRDPGLLAGLKNAIQEVLSDLPCAIEAEMRNIRTNEIGLELHFHNQDMQPAPWARSSEVKTASGLIELQVSTAAADRRVFYGRFVEKPWIENFATFASTRPEQAFIIARSLGTCTSEGEANQQALDDARARLTEAIGQRGRRLSDKLPKPEVTATDVLQGGFIVDRFAQSFEGTVGKVWRQALLIDVSGPKLAQLASQKAREFRQVKMSWARMGLSAVGVVVLIGVIYFFLNMATMGYYEWSLRIASVVLAVVGVLSILMVVH